MLIRFMIKIAIMIGVNVTFRIYYGVTVKQSTLRLLCIKCVLFARQLTTFTARSRSSFGGVSCILGVNFFFGFRTIIYHQNQRFSHVICLCFVFSSNKVNKTFSKDVDCYLQT